ncbi:hypothetical protein [Acidiferrobacter sp.]
MAWVMATRGAGRYYAVMTMTTPSMLIGARGYTHKCWQGRFYPSDLPPEWRFLFYTHRYPALLLPARSWGADLARLPALAEEAPPDFRLVLELPETALAPLAEREDWPQPLVAACLVRLSRLRPAHAAALGALARRLPVTVDLRACSEACKAELAGLGVGLCGRPAVGRPPAGPFALSLVDRIDRRALAAALRELCSVSAPAGAALFFQEAASALTGVDEALLIKGLLAGS